MLFAATLIFLSLGSHALNEIDCADPHSALESSPEQLGTACPDVSGLYRDQKIEAGDVYRGRYNAQIEIYRRGETYLFCGVMNSCHGAGEEQFHKFKIGIAEDPARSFALCSKNKVFLFHPGAGSRYELEIQAAGLSYHRCGYNRDIYDRVLNKIR